MVRYSSKNEDIIQTAEFFTQQLIGMDKQVADIINACKQHKDEFILHLYSAIFYTYGQSENAMTFASQHIESAEQLAKGINQREQRLLLAVKCQLNRDYQRAIDLFHLINLDDSQDLLPVKLAEFCYFCIGQSFEARQYLNYTQRLLPYNKESSDFLGMYSFALELTGDYDNALAYANEAIVINQTNPWAHHTLSHIYTMKKMIEEGIKVFGSFKKGWQQKDVSICSHNSWHLALLNLESLDIDSTKAIYAELETYPADLVCINIDKISLLWRMELAGYDQSECWESIAQNILEFSSEQFTPFLNAHFFYALARAKQDKQIQKSLQNYCVYAEQQAGSYHRNWFSVGMTLMKAVIAFANNDWQLCCQLLEPHIDIIGCVGGSDAQIDLFNKTYLLALIKAKHWKQAMRFLKRGTASNTPLTPLEDSWIQKIPT